MGGNDDFPVTMLIEPRNENLLVRLPGRTRNEALALANKVLYYRQLLDSCLDLQYSVEACIAYYLNIRDTYFSK